MPLLDLNDSNFWREVSEGHVLIMAGSEYCGACRIAKPQVEVIAKQNPWLEVYYVDISKNPEVLSRLDIWVMPSFVFWNDGFIRKIDGYDIPTVEYFVEKWK